MTTHAVQPFALDPLIAEAKRRMRRRRVGAALVVVAAGAIAGLALAPRLAETHAPAGDGGARFGVIARVGGLEVSIPARLDHRAATFGTMCRRHCSVTLSNGHLPSPPSLWDGVMQKSVDGVSLVFNVWPGTDCAGAGLAPCAPRLRLPVSLGELGRPVVSARGTVRNNVFRKDGRGRGLYEIGVWIGRGAPRSDIDAVLAALRSIRVAGG